MAHFDAINASHSKPIHPRASDVFEWTQSLMTGKKTTKTTRSIEELAHFGIRSFEDLLTYLNSPDGKKLKNEILNVLIEKEQALKEKVQSLNEHLLWARIRSLLVMSCCIHHEAASERIREINEKLNEKSLKNIAESIEKSTPHRAAQAHTKAREVAEIMSNYELAAKGIDAQLHEVHEQHDALLLMSEQLKAQDELIEQNFEELREKIDAYSTNLAQKDPNDRAHLESELNRLTNKLNVLVPQISVEDQSADSQALHNKRQKHLLKIAIIRDIIKVCHEKTKYFSDELGNEVSSFKDATFILNHDQRVYEKDGQYFLLQGQSWDMIQDSIEQMELAKQRYDESKRNLFSVKCRMVHDHCLEKSIHQEHVDHNHSLILINHMERLSLENQGRMIQSAMSEMKQFAKQEHLTENNKSKPTPAPRPMPSSSISKAPNAVFFKNRPHSLNLKDLTPKKFMEHLHSLPGNHSELIRTVSPMMRRLVTTAPIPAIVVQNMIRTLAQFGIDPYRRSMVPKQGPLETTYKPLTPFNTKPPHSKV